MSIHTPREENSGSERKAETPIPDCCAPFSKEHSVGDERRRALVEAACELIVEKGFEGLRVRDIARRVGINHATLHYHFPTKEDLIRAVLDQLVAKAKSARAPGSTSDSPQLRERLGGHFKDILYIMGEQPEVFIALNELHLRALRDPVIASILQERDAGWHSFLSAQLQEGIQNGTVWPHVDPDAAAATIMILFKGMPLHLSRIGGCEQAERLVKQIEAWLFVPATPSSETDNFVPNQ